MGPVLVTGGAGFLGAAMTRALVARGEKVVLFDLAPTRDALRARLDNAVIDRVETVAGDISDGATVLRAVEHAGARAIVHLAALTIPACRRHPALGAQVDVVGHVNVLEAARICGVERLLWASSIAARPRPPLDSPVNLYGAYKRACEDISKVYFLDHGIASVGLRPNVVYGPGRDVGETAAITEAIRAAAEGRPYAMPFGGTLCMQHVDEVLDIMLRCLAATPAQPVVSDLTTETESIDDLIAAIRAEMPGAQITPSGTIRPAPPGLDNAPLRALIGDWPRVGLREGVRRSLEVFAAAHA